MRRRCIRAAKRHRAAAAARVSEPVQKTSAGPIIFAETDGEPAPSAKSLQTEALLAQWPEGYRGFKLDGDDVVIFAEGKPELRFEGACR